MIFGAIASMVLFGILDDARGVVCGRVEGREAVQE
jgi:hypothetical protein